MTIEDDDAESEGDLTRGEESDVVTDEAGGEPDEGDDTDSGAETLAFEENELIIVLEDDVDDIEAEADRITSVGVDVVDTNETLNMALVAVRPTADVADSDSELEVLDTQESVKKVERNVRVQYPSLPDEAINRDAEMDGAEVAVKDVSPNDPFYSEQSAPPMINAPEAWEVTQGDSDVTIAICDSGIKYDHEDLAANMDDSVENHGYDFINDHPDPYPRTFTAEGDQRVEDHGTRTAGIAGAVTNNDVGVAGISDCSLLSIKVGDWMTGDGWGSGWAIVNGVTWAANNGADVILVNVDGSGGSRWSPFDEAVSHAESMNAITIAAAGNSGSEESNIAYASQAHMAVAAASSEEELADFSTYGEFISVVAPGTDGWTTYPASDGEPANDYSWYAGTSMASPVVAGVAGLVRSIDDTFSIEETKAIIEETAMDMGLSELEQGSGLVNAEAAVRRAIRRATEPDPLIGGVIGVNTQDGTAGDAYWDAESSELVAGITFDGGDGDVTGLDSGRMKGEDAEEHMAGFDFEERWSTDPGGYPALAWQDGTEDTQPDRPDLRLHPVDVDTVAPDESFVLSVTVEETAGLEADDVVITLTVGPSDSDENVYDDTIALDSLDANAETTVTFGEGDTDEVGPFDAKGDYEATVEATATNADTTSTTESFTVTQDDEETDAPIVVGDDPATDTTGDGLLNDVNGDGAFTITDVQVFFENLDSDAIQNNPDLFDFSGTGGDPTIADVQALFERL